MWAITEKSHTYLSKNKETIVMFAFFLFVFSYIGSLQGEYQRKLYKELMENYNRLERPVLNDSAPIVVELGLTLLQIIDVVSVCFSLMWFFFYHAGVYCTMYISLYSIYFKSHFHLLTVLCTDFDLWRLKKHWIEIVIQVVPTKSKYTLFYWSKFSVDDK